MAAKDEFDEILLSNLMQDKWVKDEKGNWRLYAQGKSAEGAKSVIIMLYKVFSMEEKQYTGWGVNSNSHIYGSEPSDYIDIECKYLCDKKLPLDYIQEMIKEAAGESLLRDLNVQGFYDQMRARTE